MKILSFNGYKVYSAGNYDETLKQFDDNDGQIIRRYFRLLFLSIEYIFCAGCFEGVCKKLYRLSKEFLLCNKQWLDRCNHKSNGLKNVIMKGIFEIRL